MPLPQSRSYTTIDRFCRSVVNPRKPDTRKVEEVQEMDYERARRRAALNRLAGIILLRPRYLRSLADAKRGAAYAGQAHGGFRQVPLERIIGSVDRADEFDHNFNPLSRSTRARWERVNRAFLDDVILPPVVLQKVGDDYYVRDGHHRISVARYHGAAYIDAEVSEYLCAEEVAA
jgi:hypothetical protein